jgi:ferredoxin-type protein NapG
LDDNRGGSIFAFLKGIFLEGGDSGVENYRVNRLRPPGAKAEKDFMALCIRCNRCLEVCPYGSIKREGLTKTIGTPYVLPESKACYLCMACCRLCPTEALDTGLTKPEKVRMGKARIDPDICYSHIFLNYDRIPKSSPKKIGAICNTCYSVCPFPDKAIALKDNLFPVVLDQCVGCGICVERCPVRPGRAINVVPTGMAERDEAGFYFRKAGQRFRKTDKDMVRSPKESPLTGEALIERKMEIEGVSDRPNFKFPYEVPDSIEEWE